MVTVAKRGKSVSSEGRILGTRVPALFPSRGPVSVLIFGEAPGPNGADKSGIPFFGDRAGLPVYEVLIDEGRCRLSRPLEGLRWDGAALAEAGVRPTLVGTALSNAYDVCPTDDGEHFRAPSKAEMGAAANVRRVRSELDKARRRGLRTVIVLGRTADWLLGTNLGLRDDPALNYHQITHPSPLGLMWLARRSGKGVRVSDVKAEWKRRFRDMLREP
jgi:hypothetical protein